MDLNLKNKTILITGANGGIGFVTAKALLEEKANVILHYHNTSDQIDELIKSSIYNKNQYLTIKADLRREKDVIDLFAMAIDKFVRIDGLVNNAGIWPENDIPLMNMTFDQWKNTMATNLNSIFLCSREFVRNLSNSIDDYASIVLIGSTAGVFGEAGHIDYSASKAAMKGFILTLKNEVVRVAKYGRVNLISPGWIATPMAENSLKNTKLVTKVLKTMPLRKIGRPTDIANLILFLMSDELSGHISGETITVSGGMEGRLLWKDLEIDTNSI